MYSFIGVNEQTGKFLFREVLSRREQFLFSNLCQLITEDNSVPYATMSELCIRTGETNRHRFSEFIKHCEELNMIKKTTRYYTKFICINPVYYKKTESVSDDTVKLFQ